MSRANPRSAIRGSRRFDNPLGHGQTGRPPVLVIVSGHSRVITARMLPSRQTGELFDGHRRLPPGRQAGPKTLVRDNGPGIGTGRLTSEFAVFTGLLAMRVRPCRSRDPEAKGLVELANGCLETERNSGKTARRIDAHQIGAEAIR